MESAVRLGLQKPVILNVGPGACSGFWLRLHPPGKTREWSWHERIRGNLARLGDAVVRSLPFGSFVCPELEEIHARAQRLVPLRIDVVDLEVRVLAAAAGYARRTTEETLFTFHQIDIARQPLRLKADLVIAYQVIERTRDARAALRNLVSAVRPGGLLSVACPETIAGFERLADGLWFYPPTLGPTIRGGR